MLEKNHENKRKKMDVENPKNFGYYDITESIVITNKTLPDIQQNPKKKHLTIQPVQKTAILRIMTQL